MFRLRTNGMNLLSSSNQITFLGALLPVLLYFLKDGCGFDHTDILTRGKTEFRQGLQLRSEAMRSNPKLDSNTWLRCNYGSTPDQPDYKTCDYVYLEFFIPTIAPQHW
jgi:hypothetical protein